MKLTALRRRLDLTTPFRVSFGEISGMDVVAVALEGGGDPTGVSVDLSIDTIRHPERFPLRARVAPAEGE